MSCKNNVSRGCCFKRNDATGEASAKYKSGCQKMDVYDWMEEIDNPTRKYDLFEVQFKNTRKGYYINPDIDVKYKKGDVVVVESNPGVNVGIITMGSDLVDRQMRRKGFNPNGCEFAKIIRFPTSTDITKWEEAIAMEHTTMIKARQICSQMELDMKVGDVEYQADKMKATFYYIADGRVDFRELIKVLAEQFRVRIEMKQIGSRQEAGLIGGIAACGRELCCSTWYNNFSTVVISAARVQDISPNPQKLAGQCGKLKCCLNYELDSYLDARERLPRVNQPLETVQANYFLVKTDVLRGIMYFSADPKNPAVQIPLPSDVVRQVQAMNKKGQKIEDLRSMVETVEVAQEPEFENVVGQDSLTRFDKSKNRNKNNRRRGGEGGERQGGDRQQGQGRPQREAREGQQRGANEGQRGNNEGQRGANEGQRGNNEERRQRDGQQQRAGDNRGPRENQNRDARGANGGNGANDEQRNPERAQRVEGGNAEGRTERNQDARNEGRQERTQEGRNNDRNRNNRNRNRNRQNGNGGNGGNSGATGGDREVKSDNKTE